MATKLYAKNNDVDQINLNELRRIPSKGVFYKAADTGQEPFLAQLMKSCLAPDTLELRVNAQVMLLKNLDQENGLVNGTRGFVASLENNENADLGPTGIYPLVRFAGCKGTIDRLITPDKFSIESQGSTLASREQVPLRLAYAITIHKYQGMTLPKAELSLGSAFEYGQAYVALSRVQSLEGLRPIDFDPKAVKAHPKVLEFYRNQRKKNGMCGEGGKRTNPLLGDD